MLADLFMTFGKGFADQFAYWCHTNLPFGRWRRPTDEVIAETRERAGRYGISNAAVDRRRAYQVARMVVPDRHGDHLADLAPDAYNEFSPTCCAKSHSGKKKIAGPGERITKFREHPQTLAFLLTPTALARLGVGASAPGTILGVRVDEAAPPAGAIAERLRARTEGKGGGDVERLAEIVAKLRAGPPAQQQEPAAA